MGFISNQWLNRGQGMRNRKYLPVPIDADARIPTDSWSRERQVVIQITASRANSECQILHLTSGEAEKLADVVVGVCGGAVRTRLALELLKGMTDTDLLKTLATHLKGRA